MPMPLSSISMTSGRPSGECEGGFRRPPGVGQAVLNGIFDDRLEQHAGDERLEVPSSISLKICSLSRPKRMTSISR